MPADEPLTLSVFTDGSHKKAPGPDGKPGLKRGWAVWCRYGGVEYTMSKCCDDFDPLESNPTMEMRAAVAALEQIYDLVGPGRSACGSLSSVVLYSDNSLVISYGNGQMDAARSTSPHFRIQALRLQELVRKFHDEYHRDGPQLSFKHVPAHQPPTEAQKNKPLEGNPAADALAGAPTGENTFVNLFAAK